MISIVIIAAGVLLTLVGVKFLLPAVFSEWQLSQRIASGETDFKDNKRRRDERIKLITRSGTLTAIGVIIVAAGLFLGFADRGDGVQVNGNASSVSVSNINESGKYEAANGKEYSYWVSVQGNEYTFCGNRCEDIDELKDKLSRLGLGETVLIIDKFATSAAYKSVSSMINEMGLKYETEDD